MTDKLNENSKQRFSVVQTSPVRWISQIHRIFLPTAIFAVLGFVIGFLLPPAFNPDVAIFIGIAFFLIALIQGRFHQYLFYEENISKQDVKKLYFLNVLIVLIQGVLLFVPSMAMHLRAVSNFPRKEIVVRDITTIRVGNVNYDYLIYKKMCLRRPDLRDDLTRQYDKVVEEAKHNPFVSQYLSGGFEGDEGCMHNLLFNGSVYDDEASLANVSVNDTTRSGKSEAIRDLLTYMESPASSTEPQLSDSALNNDSYNTAALKIISVINRHIYDSLQHEAEILMEEKYGILRVEDLQNRFEAFDTKIGYLLSNRGFDQSTAFLMGRPLLIFSLFFLYAPPCIILTVLGRRHKLSFRGFWLPLWPISLVIHLLVFGIVGGLIFLGVYVGANFTLAYIFFIMVGSFAVVRYSADRFMKTKSILRLLLLQSVHFTTIVITLLACAFVAIFMPNISDLNFFICTALVAGPVVHLLSIFFVLRYYRAQYLPKRV